MVLKKIYKYMLVVPSIALLFSGCGGSGDEGSNSYQQKEATLSFKVADSTSLLATDELASAVNNEASKAIGKPTFKFYSSEIDKLSEASKVTRDVNDTSDSNESGAKTNFFAIDENGVANTALVSNYDLKVLYSLTSKDGEHVYVALDPGYNRWGDLDWSSDTQDTRDFLAQTNCSLYKVSLEDNSYTCLDSGYLATSISENFKKVLSESNIKPLQIDEEGNLYYLAQEFEGIQDCDGCGYRFEFDSNTYPTLRKITTDSNKYSITPDNNRITNFKVLPNGTIVYIYQNYNYDEQGIKMYTPDSNNPSTGSTNTLSNDGNWWDGFFFTTDDIGTVIYGSSDGGWGDRGISFAQKHPLYEAAKISKQLNTSLFTTRNNSPTPARLMIGDDGYIYGLFVEDMGYWDNEAQIWKNKYALNVYRILPFKGSPIVSVELESHDWWKVMKGIDFHIAKGYIYYVAKDQHPKGFYGDRQVIKIIRMADGSEKTLLDGVELNGDDEIWTDRYQIFNWKMVGDTIYFSGFDEANSQVVTGEIDTVAVKAGAEVNQFLSTKDVASAVGAHAVIRDMEIVKPQEPEIDTGSAPRVLNIYTDPENLYSASIEFSKYMNKEDVIEKTSVYSFDTNNSKYDVGTMKVWLGKTMHMIFDIDEDNIATDPLKNGTQYFIEIDNEARDKWNTELATFEGVGAVTTKSFTTVPDQGWYATTDERIDGITDGVVARYIDNSLVRSNDKYALIKDNIGSANMKIEFSFKMKGTNNNNRISLKLKDSKKVDWDNVNWDNDTQKIYSDNSKNQEIIRVEGHFIDKDNNEYQESWQSNTRMLTDTTNNILYTWKEGYRYDSDENRYTVHWNNQGEYVKKFDSVGDYLSTYYRVEGFYEDTNGTKYRHESGEYRNIDNFDDIIDWSDGKEYTWFDSVYVTDINDLDSVIDGFNFWDLSEMRSGFDSNVTEETERIDFTFLWNNDDTLTESSELKWVREYYENNETNVTYNEWDNNWVWDIDRTQYYTDNNTSWDWDGRVLDLTVNSWQNINYNYITGSLNNRSDSWGNVDINFDYKNIWLKGVIKIYGSNFTFSFVDDQGESFEIVNKTDIFTTTQTNSGNYRLDMQLEDSRDLVMDNFVITPLDTNGEEIGDPILNETFDGNILNSPVTLTHQYSNN